MTSKTLFANDVWEAAIQEVEELVVGVAQAIIDSAAWDYELVGEGEAPETYNDLCKAAIDQIIPIADYGSNESIYSSAEVNGMFRFWHDVLHLEHGHSFSMKGETAVAELHLEWAVLNGLSPLARAILWADTYGQVCYYDRHKQFVSNQKAFVREYVQSGHSLAVRTVF